MPPPIPTKRHSTKRWGQQLMGKLMTSVRFWEEEMPAVEAKAYIGQAYTNVTPLGLDDKGQSRVQQFSSPDLSSYFFSQDFYSSLQLPSVLKSLSIAYEQGGGAADYTETAVATASGAFSVGLNASGTAQASAQTVPKPIQDIQNYSRERAKFKRCWFYADDLASVLSRLTAELGATVLEWPNFKERSITLSFRGEKQNATARASVQGSASLGSSGGSTTNSQGFGEGFDSSIDIGQLQLPPTLHGAFTLTGSDSLSHNGTVTVIISGGALSGGFSDSVAAGATASVTPTSIAATSPTDIPSTGLYLYSLNIEPNETLNNNFVDALVFDFASL